MKISFRCLGNCEGEAFMAPCISFVLLRQQKRNGKCQNPCGGHEGADDATPGGQWQPLWLQHHPHC